MNWIEDNMATSTPGSSESIHIMASDKDQLLSMGFEADRVDCEISRWNLLGATLIRRLRGLQGLCERARIPVFKRVPLQATVLQCLQY